jgi:hypothetical protein
LTSARTSTYPAAIASSTGDFDFEFGCWREQRDGELASTFGSCVRCPVEADGRHCMDCEVLIEEIVAGVDETALKCSLASIPSGSICRP